MRRVTEAEMTKTGLALSAQAKEVLKVVRRTRQGKDASRLSLRRLVQDVAMCLSTNSSMAVGLSGCHDKVLGFY